MNKDLKRLRKEINNVNFDPSVLDNIKKQGGLENYRTEETSRSTYVKSPRKKTWLRYAPIAASLCCILILSVLLAFPGGGAPDNPTLMTVNTNSLIEFTIDENENVTSQRALKKKGVIVLLNNDFTNQNYAKSCEEVILTAEKLDIIENSDKIEIMIIDDDPQLENQLTQKLSYELKTSSVASAVENDFVFTTPMLTSVKNDADKYGVSYSKMSLVNEANTLRNIPIREAVSMSTQQLIDHVYGYSESKINIFQNNVTSDFIAFNKQCSTAFSDLDTIAAMLEKDNCDEADYRYMENTLRQIAMFHMIFADIINIDTISHDITDGVDVFLPKLNNFNHQQKAMEAQLVLEYKSQLLNKMQS